MGSGSDITCAGSSTSQGKRTPFAQVMVTLSKEEEIKRRWEANYWKSQHQQALVRLAQREADHRLAMAESAAREAALRSELDLAEGKIRDLQKRLFGRKSERSAKAEKGVKGDGCGSFWPRKIGGISRCWGMTGPGEEASQVVCNRLRSDYVPPQEAPSHGSIHKRDVF